MVPETIFKLVLELSERQITRILFALQLDSALQQSLGDADTADDDLEIITLLEKATAYAKYAY